MWLESHGNLARHPKTRRLMQRMGWTLPHTIGNLHLLWWWALEYAPTGDLTSYEPEQITYDLDLGDSTPEEFLGAMVQAGFLNRGESGTLRLHDWPDYTAKSLRPKYRRDPEKWHDVLRSYNRPIFTRRTTRRVVGVASVPPSSASTVEHEPLEAVHIDPDKIALAAEQSVPTCAEREPQSTELENGLENGALATKHSAPSSAPRERELAEPGSQGADRVDCIEGCSSRPGGSEGSGSDRNQSSLRADPRISALDSDTSNRNLPGSDSATSSTEATFTRHTPHSDLGVGVSATELDSTITTGVTLEEKAPIPKSLTARKNFNAWWLKLQECYQNKGCPLTAYEQGELLAMFARNPFTAVEKLQYSVVNFETSYASLLGKQKLKTSVEHGPTGGSG